MVGGNWLDNTGLYRQYGTTKAVPETAGDFLSYGSNRVVEVIIDLTTLTSTAQIISNTTFMGTSASNQIIIEKVEMVVETAATATSTLSVGLIQTDRATVPTNYGTALINTETTAHMTAGAILTYTESNAGAAGAGGLVGSQPANATSPYYLTATGTSTAFTAGKVRVRIFYHAIGTITQ